MKIQLVLIILLCVIIPLALASNTQDRFKVCVQVIQHPDNDLDDRLEALIKKELRALGDVDIVDLYSNWYVLCVYNFGEITFKDGRKSGHITIASGRFIAVPKYHFKSNTYPHQDVMTKPVWYVGVTPAYWYIDDLHEYAIRDAARIDKLFGEPYRKKFE